MNFLDEMFKKKKEAPKEPEKPKRRKRRLEIDHREVRKRQNNPGGQQSAQKPPNSEENVSRTSSVTNLAETKGKGEKLVKSKRSGSKDRLDKAQNEIKKKISKNEMNLGDNDQEINQNQIEGVNKGFEMDQKAILEELEGELRSLKENFNKISDENLVLRTRLKDVSHSPLSDNEKQQLLTLNDGLNLLKSTEIDQNEVFLLKEAQKKMQETIFCTNEELQATLQELNDLQKQLTDLQQDNDQLIDEKNLMFDSLCRQTERLNETKNELEGFKTIYNQKIAQKNEKDSKNDDLTSKLEKLTEKFDSTQKELENLKLTQNELENQLKLTQNELKSKEIDNLNLQLQLNLKSEEIEIKSNEIVQLKQVLTNYSIKINDLQQQNQTEIEKKSIENSIENEKLKSQIGNLQCQLEKLQNNSKLTQNELQIELGSLKVERNELVEELKGIKLMMKEIKGDLEKEMEEKNRVLGDLGETKKVLGELEVKNEVVMGELEDLRRIRKEENEEWEKFQNDLLTSVRVANDFKTEAQQDLQKIVSENKAYREKICQLEVMVEKLSGDQQNSLTLTNSGNFVESVCENEEMIRSSSKIEDLNEGGFPQPDEIINLSEPKELIESKSRPNKHFIKKPKIFRASKGYHFVQDDEKPQREVIIKDLKRLPVKEMIQESKESQEKKKIFSVPKIGAKKIDQTDKNLMILNDLYREIDPTIPEEDLTQEQRVIIQLKRSYDVNSNQKSKKRVNLASSRSNLVISKPLLNSVFQNRKLKEVIDDPTMKSVDEGDNVLFGAPNVFYPTNFDDVYRNNIEFRYYNEEKSQNKNFTTFRSDSLIKSKSLTDLTVKDEEFRIKRQLSESVLSRSDDEDSFSSVNEDDLDGIYKEMRIGGVFEEKKKEIEKKNEDLLQNKVLVKKGVKKNLVISAPIQESILNDEKLMKIVQDDSIKSLSPPKKSSMFVKIKSKLPKKSEIERCYVYDQDEKSVIDGTSLNKNDSIPPTETFNTYLKNKIENEERKSVEVQTDDDLDLNDSKERSYGEKNEDFDDQVKIKSLIEKSGRLNSLKRKEELEIMYQLMRNNEKPSRLNQGHHNFDENEVKIEDDSVKIEDDSVKVEDDSVKIDNDSVKIVDEMKKIGSKNGEGPMVVGPSSTSNFDDLKKILETFLTEERNFSTHNLIFRKNPPQLSSSASILMKRRSRNLRKPTGIDLDFDDDLNESKLSRNSSFKSTTSQDSQNSNEDEIMKNISAKLDDDEVEVIRTLRRKYKVRERPRSGINEDDLRLIEEAKKKCLSPEYQNETWGFDGDEKIGLERDIGDGCDENNRSFCNLGDYSRDIGRMTLQTEEIGGDGEKLRRFGDDFDEKIGKIPPGVGRLPLIVTQLSEEMNKNEDFVDRGRDIDRFDENWRENVKKMDGLPPGVVRLPLTKSELPEEIDKNDDVSDRGRDIDRFVENRGENVKKADGLPPGVVRLPLTKSELPEEIDKNDDVSDRGRDIDRFDENRRDNVKKMDGLPPGVVRLPQTKTQLPEEIDKNEGFNENVDDLERNIDPFVENYRENLEKIVGLPPGVVKLPPTKTQLLQKMRKNENVKEDFVNDGDFLGNPDDFVKKIQGVPTFIVQIQQQNDGINDFNPEKIRKFPGDVGQLPPTSIKMSKNENFDEDVDKEDLNKKMVENPVNFEKRSRGLPVAVTRLSLIMKNVEDFQHDDDKKEEMGWFRDEETGKLQQGVGGLPVAVNRLSLKMDSEGFQRDGDDKGEELRRFRDDFDQKSGKLSQGVGELPVAVNRLSLRMKNVEDFQHDDDKEEEMGRFRNDCDEETGKLRQGVGGLPVAVDRLSLKMDTEDFKRNDDDKGEEMRRFRDDFDQDTGKLLQGVGGLPVAVNRLSLKIDSEDFKRDDDDKREEMRRFRDNFDQKTEKLLQGVGELPVAVNRLSQKIKDVEDFQHDDDKEEKMGEFRDDFDQIIGKSGKLPQDEGRLPLIEAQIPLIATQIPLISSQLPQEMSEMKEIDGFKRDDDENEEKIREFRDDFDTKIEKNKKLPRDDVQLPLPMAQIPQKLTKNESFKDNFGGEKDLINEFIANPVDFVEKIDELPVSVTRPPRQIKKNDGFKRDGDDKEDIINKFVENPTDFVENTGGLPAVAVTRPPRKIKKNEGFKRIVGDEGEEKKKIEGNLVKIGQDSQNLGGLPNNFNELSKEIDKNDGFTLKSDDEKDESDRFGDNFDDITKLVLNDSKLNPNDSKLTPNGSKLTQNDSKLTPNGSKLTPNDSKLTPNGSKLILNDSKLMSNDTKLTPNDSKLAPNDFKLSQNVENQDNDDKGNENIQFLDPPDDYRDEIGELSPNVEPNITRLDPNIIQLDPNITQLESNLRLNFENDSYGRDVDGGLQKSDKFMENAADYFKNFGGFPQDLGDLKQKMKKIYDEVGGLAPNVAQLAPNGSQLRQNNENDGVDYGNGQNRSDFGEEIGELSPNDNQLSNIAQLEPNITQISWNFIQLGSNETKKSPDLAQLAPNETQLSQNFIELAPNDNQLSPNDNKFSPNDQLMPNETQISPNVAQMAPNGTQLQQNFVKLAPNDNQLSSNFQLGPNGSRLASNFNQLAPNITQLSPQIKKNENVGQEIDDNLQIRSKSLKNASEKLPRHQKSRDVDDLDNFLEGIAVPRRNKKGNKTKGEFSGKVDHFERLSKEFGEKIEEFKRDDAKIDQFGSPNDRISMNINQKSLEINKNNDFERLAPNVNELEPNITQLSRKIDKNDGFEELESNVIKLAPNVVKLEPNSNELEANIAQLAPNITQLSQEIVKNDNFEELEGNVIKSVPNVVKLEPNSSKLAPNITQLIRKNDKNDDFKQLEPKFKELEPNVTQLEPNSNEFELDSNKLEPNSNKLAPNITQLLLKNNENDDFKQLEPKFKELEPNIAQLETNSNELAPNISRLAPNITHLKRESNENDSFKSFSPNIKGLESNIVEFEPNITELAPNNTNLMPNNTELAPNMTQLSRKMNENDDFKQITANVMKLEPNSTELAPNITELAPNNNKLMPNNTELESKMAQLSRKNDEIDRFKQISATVSRLEPNITELAPNITELAPNNIKLMPNNTELTPNITQSSRKNTESDGLKQISANIIKLEPNITELAPNNTKLMPNNTELGPNITQLTRKNNENDGFKQISAEVVELEPNITELAPNITELTPNNTKLMPNNTELGPNITQLTQKNDEIDSFKQISAKVVELEPNITELAPNITKLAPNINKIPRKNDENNSFEGDFDVNKQNNIKIVDYERKSSRLPQNFGGLPRNLEEFSPEMKKIESSELKIDDKKDEIKLIPRKSDDNRAKLGEIPRGFSRFPAEINKKVEFDQKINLELYQPKPYQRRSFENLNSTWRNQKTGEILEKKKHSNPFSPNRLSYQQISLDTSTFYEPIYENFSIFQQKRPNSINFESNLSKNPVPQPRKDLLRDEKTDFEGFDELSLEKVTFDDVKGLIREKSRKMSVNQDENEGKFDVDVKSDEEVLEKEKFGNEEDGGDDKDEIKGDDFDHLENMLENLKEMRRKIKKDENEKVKIEEISNKSENFKEELTPKVEITLRKSEEKISTPAKEIRASKSKISSKNITKDRVSLLRQKFEGKSDEADPNHHKDKLTNFKLVDKKPI